MATVYQNWENKLVQCGNSLPKKKIWMNTIWQQFTENKKTIKYSMAKFTVYLKQEN